HTRRVFQSYFDSASPGQCHELRLFAATGTDDFTDFCSYSPRAQPDLMRTRSINICKLSRNILTLVPLTWFHLVGTSAIENPNRFPKNNTSTSKPKPLSLCAENNISADRALNSLNPHCVS